MEQILRQAIAFYGAEHQENMCIEEMAELAVAILHKRRGREHNIPEEIADVEIMLEQMKMVHCCAEDVERIKVKKLQRLKNNTEEG